MWLQTEAPKSVYGSVTLADGAACRMGCSQGGEEGHRVRVWNRSKCTSSLLAPQEDPCELTAFQRMS